MKIALNGYGRVGRSFIRALVEREASGWTAPFAVVAINDLGTAEDLHYLTKYDTAHGVFLEQVELINGRLRIGNHAPQLLHENDPSRLPWKQLGVDLVLECTGEFRSHKNASQHLLAGAERVMIGAVPFDHADALMVWGVNHEALQDSDRVLSATSCTTQCITPLLALLDREYGVEQVLMKEVHAYTSDQSLLDHVHRDPRRGRAAAQNIVPTTSSAIGAVQKVLPQLAGRISGDSIRVPTLNVAMVDLTLALRRTPTVAQINQLFADAADNNPELFGYNTEQLVSSDFNHRPESAIYDATQTRIQGDLVHIVAWYDNEWGYANRLLDLVDWLAHNNHTSTDS